MPSITCYINFHITLLCSLVTVILIFSESKPFYLVVHWRNETALLWHFWWIWVCLSRSKKYPIQKGCLIFRFKLVTTPWTFLVSLSVILTQSKSHYWTLMDHHDLSRSLKTYNHHKHFKPLCHKHQQKEEERSVTVDTAIAIKTTVFVCLKNKLS